MPKTAQTRQVIGKHGIVRRERRPFRACRRSTRAATALGKPDCAARDCVGSASREGPQALVHAQVSRTNACTLRWRRARPTLRLTSERPLGGAWEAGIGGWSDALKRRTASIGDVVGRGAVGPIREVRRSFLGAPPPCRRRQGHRPPTRRSRARLPGKGRPSRPECLWISDAGRRRRRQAAPHASRAAYAAFKAMRRWRRARPGE